MSPTAPVEAKTSASENPAVIDVALIKARRLEELKAFGEAYVQEHSDRLAKHSAKVGDIVRLEREATERSSADDEARELDDPIIRELAATLRHLQVPVLVVPAHLAYKHAFSDTISQSQHYAAKNMDVPRMFPLRTPLDASPTNVPVASY